MKNMEVKAIALAAALLFALSACSGGNDVDLGGVAALSPASTSQAGASVEATDFERMKERYLYDFFLMEDAERKYAEWCETFAAFTDEGEAAALAAECAELSAIFAARDLMLLKEYRRAADKFAEMRGQIDPQSPIIRGLDMLLIYSEAAASLDNGQFTAETLDCLPKFVEMVFGDSVSGIATSDDQADLSYRLRSQPFDSKPSDYFSNWATGEPDGVAYDIFRDMNSGDGNFVDAAFYYYGAVVDAGSVPEQDADAPYGLSCSETEIALSWGLRRLTAMEAEVETRGMGAYYAVGQAPPDIEITGNGIYFHNSPNGESGVKAYINMEVIPAFFIADKPENARYLLTTEVSHDSLELYGHSDNSGGLGGGRGTVIAAVLTDLMTGEIIWSEEQENDPPGTFYEDPSDPDDNVVYGSGLFTLDTAFMTELYMGTRAF